MLDGGLFALAGAGAGFIFVIFILWSIVWKGLALWISAREQKKWWFMVLLIINTAGILEIIYILGFSAAGREYLSSLKAKREAKKNTKEVKAEEVEEDDDEDEDDEDKCEKCGHEEGGYKCDCKKED